jgi:hypothetical protein
MGYKNSFIAGREENPSHGRLVIHCKIFGLSYFDPSLSFPELPPMSPRPQVVAMRATLLAFTPVSRIRRRIEAER